MGKKTDKIDKSVPPPPPSTGGSSSTPLRHSKSAAPEHSAGSSDGSSGSSSGADSPPADVVLTNSKGNDPSICTSTVRDNATLKNGHQPATFNNLQNCSLPVRDNAPATLTAPDSCPLRPNASPFIPGTVDALWGSLHHGGSTRSPPAAITEQQQSNLDTVPSKTASVWGKRAPAAFPLDDDPIELFLHDGVVMADEADTTSIRAKFEHALVGRIVGKTFPFDWLSKQLHLKWGCYEGFKVSDLGEGCFVLFFSCKAHRDQVWLGGPWHVAGRVVGLDRWSEKFVPSMNPNLCVPTWIRLPGLPIHLWGAKNLKRFALQLGDPICIDALTISLERTSYARFCVRRNLSMPLIGGLRISSHGSGEFFQKIQYEGQSTFCTACGLEGHTIESCPPTPPVAAPLPENAGNPRPGLDGWTLVPPRRPSRKLHLAAKPKPATTVPDQPAALQAPILHQPPSTVAPTVDPPNSVAPPPLPDPGMLPMDVALVMGDSSRPRKSRSHSRSKHKHGRGDASSDPSVRKRSKSNTRSRGEPSSQQLAGETPPLQ